MPETLSLRLSGDETGIGAVLAALRGMPDVDSVVELSLDVPGANDDSSSAGTPDDSPPGTGTQDVRLHMPSSLAYDHVHGRIETLAAGAGVVVEWLDLEGE